MSCATAPPPNRTRCWEKPRSWYRPAFCTNGWGTSCGTCPPRSWRCGTTGSIPASRRAAGTGRGRSCFAGSLWPAKVAWLYRAEAPRPALLLHGHGYDAAQNAGLGDSFGGPFDPDNPVFEPPVGWGLVWDGAKLDSGDTGLDYERFNQPHKISLYLACGLPLIVWSEGYAARW